MGPMSEAKVLVTPLAEIPTYGGNVLHAIKEDSIGFSGFGEAYFSWVDHGVIKGWKRHSKMAMNIVVPVGDVRFVFCDANRDGSRYFIHEDIGESRYARLTIQPGLWFAFRGMSAPRSLVLNIANIKHDPSEVERLDVSHFQYSWN